MALVDFPGLLFFTTYTLLVLFWAEIYHQVHREIVFLSHDFHKYALRQVSNGKSVFRQETFLSIN